MDTINKSNDEGKDKKIVITSEELANAIQKQSEVSISSAVAPIDNTYINCMLNC